MADWIEYAEIEAEDAAILAAAERYNEQYDCAPLPWEV